MKPLKITQLKPNPAGKDRPRLGPLSPAQLGAEWVDFKNIGAVAVDLGNVKLYHRAYSLGEIYGHWELVTGFTGSLSPGKIVRVHSGNGPETVLRPEDLSGADHHIFTRRDAYIWNNLRGDIAGLGLDSMSKEIDKASYDPNPPEGVILVRNGEKLIPAVPPLGGNRLPAGFPYRT